MTTTSAITVWIENCHGIQYKLLCGECVYLMKSDIDDGDSGDGSDNGDGGDGVVMVIVVIVAIVSDVVIRMTSDSDIGDGNKG